MTTQEQIDFLTNMRRGASPFISKKLAEIIETLHRIKDLDDE